MRLTSLIVLVGLCSLFFMGCGASSDELVSDLVTAENARMRLLAQGEIVKLGGGGIEVFARLLDFPTVRNLYEIQVPHERLAEMTDEDILRDVNDIRITAVRGMASIGSVAAAQPLIDAAYLPQSQTEKPGEPIFIGEDELSLELAAEFRSEVMIALGQLPFASEEEREKAIDLFSYGANDPSPRVRVSTAGSLAELRLYESGYFLKQLAEDEATAVRAAAFRAINAIGNHYVEHAKKSLSIGDEKTAELDRKNLKILQDSVFQHCLAALEDPQPSVRIPAIGSLGVFDDPASVTPLMRYLADANEDVRSAVVNTLSTFENEEGKKAVETAALAVLGEEEPQRRMMAALVLGRMRTGGTALESALLAPDELWFVKLQLINSLANLGQENYLETINLFLDDPDRDVRVAAIGAVGSLGGSEDLDRLLGYALTDKTLVPAATHAVASIADYAQLQPYLGADNDHQTRLIAIKALGMRSDRNEPAPPALVELFQDPDLSIVKEALATVARYDFKDFRVQLADLVRRAEDDYTIFEETKNDYDALATSLNDIISVKMQAAKMLASHDNRDGINYFIELLADESVGRRLIGVACLGNIGHSRGVMATVGLLGDGSDYVRWGAAQVLGVFADSRTTGFLGQALEDPSPWVQQSAIASLLAIGDKNTIADVHRLLARNVEPAVKAAALDFISRMGDKRMAEDVARLLSDEDPEVCFAAATCLTRQVDEEGRGMSFFAEALDSTTILTLTPGLPSLSPFAAGVRLLAAELTGTPESRIKELTIEPTKVPSWAFTTRILTGELASAETYALLAEKALTHDYLLRGLFDNVVQWRPTAYAAFEPYLSSDDADLRRLGYSVMVRIGGDRVLERLTRQFSERPEDAADLIVALDDLGAQTTLRHLFRTAEEEIRVLVAQRFAGWTDKRMPLIWGQIAAEDQSLAVRMTVLEPLAADPTGVGRVYLEQLIEAADTPPALASAARGALAGAALPPPPPPGV